MTTTPLTDPGGLDLDEAVDAAMRQIAGLGPLWHVPDLADRVSVEFSRRLTSSLGLCRPAQGRLTIADRLRAGPPSLLAEVVAHEAAHAASFVLHGDRIRPHGQEWKGLMLTAGYPARRALEVPDALRPQRRRRYVWRHRCQTCDAFRDAGRPVYEWRCAPCWRSGRGGTLAVTRLDAGG